MEYNLKINEAALRMEVGMAEGNGLTAMIDEKKYTVHYTTISENRVHLVIDDGVQKKGINAYVAETADGRIVSINGVNFQLQEMDAVSQQQSRKKGGNDLPDHITPPMPAVVISTLVLVGDTVEKGQAVVVISAMKMETTLKAPYAGKVIGINVAEGDKVSPGDILIDIEK